MNCHEFRKYLFAFADGQIDVKSNCDLLDHLKMCPRCARIVDQHQSLKALIAASAARIGVPGGLEARVRKAIGIPVKALRTPAAKSSVRAGRPLVRVLALAACVVLAFIGLWVTGVIGPGEILRGGASFVFADADGMADRITQSVVIQHNKCVESCNEQAHHRVGIPDDRMAAAETIQSDLGGHVAVAAPDLTGFGFEFESAAICSPSRDIHGATAHLMYVNNAYGTRLSFFSVPHWSAADPLLGETSLRRPFARTLGNCENQSVVAWNGESTTYIVCGPINHEDLAEMVSELAFSMPADAVANANQP